MPAILKQRKLFTTKIFRITDKSLQVTIRNPFSLVGDEFTFEQLTKKTTSISSANTLTLLLAAILLLGVIITVTSNLTEGKSGSHWYDIAFFFVPFVILLVASYFTHKRETSLFLADGRRLVFFTNKPDEKEFSDFLALIASEQKKYLINRYARQDPYLSSEQVLNNLQWLYDRDIVDFDELESLREKLLNRAGTDSQVGFKFKPRSN